MIKGAMLVLWLIPANQKAKIMMLSKCILSAKSLRRLETYKARQDITIQN